jgi:hypothetical protein
MATDHLARIFSPDVTDRLFPADRADRFFDALYGDIEEGAYDIHLAFTGALENKLHFEFQLDQRPGKCLACHLTYGLPDVFTRHPIVNINGLVQKIEGLLHGQSRCTGWELGSTVEISRTRHAIPFIVFLAAENTLPA